MSCRNKRGCGCNRSGAINIAPPCNCGEHEECQGEKCSEIINADCVILKRDGYTFSIDGGITYSERVSLSDAIIAMSTGNFIINNPKK